MEALLVTARAFHFAAAILLAGTFAFECLIADAALRDFGPRAAAGARLRRRFNAIAWASLALAVASGAAWLTATSAAMSGQPIGAVLSQSVLATVLTQTRFGEDWLLRLGLAALVALCLAAHQVRILRWLALGTAAAMLASLAWAGHGGATPSAPGELHLAGDILHLLGAGLWLGTLMPLEMLLAEAGRAGGPAWLAAARVATRRFTYLAAASVAALLLGGLVNTWFLAGTIPALVGTEYGRLLLAKISLFVAMLLVAAVNLLRLTPRLAAEGAPGAAPTIAQLRRNALIETALGLGVVGIVGLLGTLPPGLHSEPGWPFPFRLDLRALSTGTTIAAALAGTVCCACVVAAVAVAAAARYRRLPAVVAGAVLFAVAASIALRPTIKQAFPTSFYAPAEPFAAGSIVKGAALYADNCAACHGAGGRGDGPAAAGLSIHPTNLTRAPVLAQSPGDLFWWVTHGRDNGAMPGFANVLSPNERWDLVNFVRGRAAGILVQQLGPETADRTYPVPDLAFEHGGMQSTLRRVLENGPVLLVLFAGPPPSARLQQLAAAQDHLAGAGLGVFAVALDPEQKTAAEEPASPLLVGVSAQDRSALGLYRSPADGGETELLLDRNGDVRARWSAAAGNLPDAATLAADAARVAEFAIPAPSHAGHTH